MTEQNLILGMAAGYSQRDLEPFVISLGRSGYRGRCRIFVNHADAEAQAFLFQHGIEVGLAPSSYDRLWQTARRLGLGHRVTRALESTLLRALEPLSRSASARVRRSYRALAPIHATGLRYLLYLEYLSDPVSPPVDRVFLADTRDLIFQSDPFAAARTSQGLTMFLEERSMTIGACLANARWMSACYGAAGLAAIADRPIFCSGTMLGDRDAIVRYLRVLIREITHVAGRRFVEASGFDQACHNHLLYGALKIPFVSADNGTSVVMQLAHRASGDIRFSADGQVLNDDGSVVPVVHQWDRHGARFQTMLDRLRT